MKSSIAAVATAALLLAAVVQGAPSPRASASGNTGAPGPWATATNMRCIAYSPSIEGFCGQNTPAVSDSDWTSDSFQALWGVDPTPGVVSRNDLQTLADAGFNCIKLYDYNPATWTNDPNSGYMRNHQPFFDYAQSLGLAVVVPVSNWVFKGNMQYADTVARNTIGSTRTKSGDIHPAVYAWSISNEPDDGSGISMVDVATMIKKMAALDSSNTRPFTVPFTTTVHASATPSGNVFGGAQELEKLLPADIWQNRFIVGTNAFQNIDGFNKLILDGYLAAFPNAATRPPFWVSESGINNADDQAQTDVYLPVLCRMTDLMNAGSNRFSLAGFAIFEYEAEWCKENRAGGDEYDFGLNFASGDMSAAKQPTTKPYYDGTLTHQLINPTPYPVPNLKPRTLMTKVSQLLSDPVNNFHAVCGSL